MTMQSIGEKAMLGYNELLTETCSYQKYTSVNKYNEKEYDAPLELKCFQSFDFKNDKNYVEQDVRLTKKVFITNEFQPHSFDKVDGMEIQFIKPVKSLIDGLIGWEIIV